MDILQLNDWLKDIQVRNLINEDVEVVNNTPLVMIGKGRQGAVFQIDKDVCVKVFGNVEDCEREYYALSLGKETNLFPRLYGNGPLYIAMEIIKGVDLREYLQSQPLTKALSKSLIEMLITFKKIGFERIDHHKRQIYLQPDGNLKVIDVARAVWRDRVYPYPHKLLTSLGEENKKIFLSHVQEMYPDLYNEWLHYIRMEEISRKIFQILLPEPPEKDTLKNLSKKLLTTKDEKNYVVQLQGLVHKVFKEEWVKTMLARGQDPDKVMEKIDEYWDKLEQNGSRDRGRDRDSDRDRDRKRDSDKDRNRDRKRDSDKDRDRDRKRDSDRDRHRDRDRKHGKDRHHVNDGHRRR
jgi:predicted Ser/Thr protein kinase